MNGDCGGGKLVCYLGRVYTIHKSRRRGLSSLDVGASTCVHMMKMDGVIENRFRVPEKCRGKTPNIGAKRALPLQRALPDLSLSNPGRGNASVDTSLRREEREERQALCFVQPPPSLPRSNFFCMRHERTYLTLGSAY